MAAKRGLEKIEDGIEALKSERNRQKQLTDECDLLRCLSRSEVANSRQGLKVNRGGEQQIERSARLARDFRSADAR